MVCVFLDLNRDNIIQLAAIQLQPNDFWSLWKSLQEVPFRHECWMGSLFADFCGSTSLAEPMNPSEIKALSDPVKVASRHTEQADVDEILVNRRIAEVAELDTSSMDKRWLELEDKSESMEDRVVKVSLSLPELT